MVDEKIPTWANQTPGFKERFRLQQLLLLDVIFLPAQEAALAWKQWRSEFTFEAVEDFCVSRLFPQVYLRLLELEIKEPEISAIKGAYCKAWYWNQLAIAKTSTIANQLREYEIDTMLLKGMALSASYYNDYGLRPSQDIDILINKNNATKCIDILAKHGWCPETEDIDTLITYEHAISLVDRDRFSIDLHWAPLIECLRDTQNKQLWEDSLEISLLGTQIRVPSPTDSLFQCLIHGIRGPEETYYWAADAMRIVSSRKVDWRKLAMLAEQNMVRPQLIDAICCIDERWSLALPDGFVKNLKSANLSFVERVYLQERKGVWNSPIAGFIYRLSDFQKLGPDAKKDNALRGFINYLRFFWKIPTNEAIMPHIFKKISLVVQRYFLRFRSID